MIPSRRSKNISVVEWSESYTFLKVLVDSLIVNCDDELSPVDNDYVVVKELVYLDKSGAKFFKPKSSYPDLSQENESPIRWMDFPTGRGWF